MAHSVGGGPGASEDRVPVGYIRRAHGIRGAVVVRPTTDAPDRRFRPGAAFDTDRGRLEIASVAPHKDGLVVTFVGIVDRAAAEELRGTSLTIAPSERRELASGEYWPDELVGCRVDAPDGSMLGSVADVVVGAAQDRLVVRTLDGRAVEVPFVDALVPDVDVSARRIVVDAPEGLFEAQ